MQMTFRWYGEGNDRIQLSDIKRIPGVRLFAITLCPFSTGREAICLREKEVNFQIVYLDYSNIRSREKVW